MKSLNLKTIAAAVAAALNTAKRHVVLFAKMRANHYAHMAFGAHATQDYSLQDLDRYDVNAPGAVEKVRQRFYDYQVYPTAGATQFTFFAQPVGQGTSSSPGNAAGVKTLADTNMQLAGQLPSPQAFIVESIEVVIFPGSSTAANTFATQPPWDSGTNAAAMVSSGASGASDVNAIGVAGFLNFFIGSKSYLTDAPIGAFPPKTWPEVRGALAGEGGGSSSSQSMASVLTFNWAGRPYYLDPPITLRATQNFNVTLNWPVAVATPSGFNARIGVILDGVLFRKAQ